MAGMSLTSKCILLVSNIAFPFENTSILYGFEKFVDCKSSMACFLLQRREKNNSTIGNEFLLDLFCKVKNIGLIRALVSGLIR